MNNLIYREAQPGDENQVLKLIEVVLSEYNLNLEPQGADKDVTNLKSNYLTNNGWFQVVENGEKIIGSVDIYKIDNNECELRKMYLYPEYQVQGIGSTLMRTALEKAKQLGYKYMTLQTNSILIKALPLYKKYGFINDDSIETCSRCDIAMKIELV